MKTAHAHLLTSVAATPRKKREPKPRPLPLPIDDIEDMPAGKRVILHYPPVLCSPNSRAHWRKQAAVKASYRHECFVEARIAGFDTRVTPIRPTTGKVHMRIDIFPPPGVAPDFDNAIASFKAGQDGVAAALDIDDGRFEIEHILHPEKRCCVVVTLLPNKGVAL